mgnify:CR=1 FL=1
MENLDQIREQNRWKPDKEEEVNDSENALSRTTIFFMITVALIIDGIQAVLLYFAIGVVVNTFIGIFAGFTFWLWFKMHDVGFVTPKQIAAMGGGFFTEVIPGVDALPAWTGAVAYVIFSHKALEAAEKMPGGKMARVALQTTMAGTNAYKATAIQNTNIGDSVQISGKKYAGTKQPSNPTDAAKESQMTPEKRKTNLMSQQYTQWQKEMKDLNKIRRTNSVQPTEEYYNTPEDSSNQLKN